MFLFYSDTQFLYIKYEVKILAHFAIGRVKRKLVSYVGSGNQEASQKPFLARYVLLYKCLTGSWIEKVRSRKREWKDGFFY
ncbi:MAG: hypothetical protein BM556_11700 [Bacteriovorax sp. MedPE-SWde]|nr:MAG: hypothetical protein BM556_11700 [Bacteriovorax sp. MedPE-SWde]